MHLPTTPEMRDGDNANTSNGEQPRSRKREAKTTAAEIAALTDNTNNGHFTKSQIQRE